MEGRMGLFDEVLSESSYVLKKIAQAREEGEARGRAEAEAMRKAKGRAEGEIKGTIAALQEFMKARFPSLAAQARRRLSAEKDMAVLRSLSKELLSAQDEESVRRVLNKQKDA
jgi:flagellar biosynthesis/type III secretory pathway protein FliH